MPPTVQAGYNKRTGSYNGGTESGFTENLIEEYLHMYGSHKASTGAALLGIRYRSEKLQGRDDDDDGLRLIVAL